MARPYRISQNTSTPLSSMQDLLQSNRIGVSLLAMNLVSYPSPMSCCVPMCGMCCDVHDTERVWAARG
jgi:hypothetical protein